MRWSPAIPAALFALGILFVTDAGLHGRGSAGWVVSVPVLAGAPVEFGLGVAALAAGFLTVPILWAGAFRAPETDGSVETEPRNEATFEEQSVAVIVIGPLPVFVGAWRKATTALRWFALVSVSLLALVLVLALLWY
jgi:uncharacterized membrane protein